jgi:hypothetical protein
MDKDSRLDNVKIEFGKTDIASGLLNTFQEMIKDSKGGNFDMGVGNRQAIVV